jgi:hypothetical protein
MTFNDWFVSQHGPRPSAKPLDELMKERNAKLAEVDTASRIVDACDLWDLRRTSALLAWQAHTSSLDG